MLTLLQVHVVENIWKKYVVSICFDRNISNINMSQFNYKDFKGGLNSPVILLIKSLALDLDGCFYFLKARTKLGFFDFAVSRNSQRVVLESPDFVVAWHWLVWDMTAHLWERTFGCFSIFAHIHRLHFLCVSLVEAMAAVWGLKSRPGEVGVRKITWENVLSWAGCSAGREVIHKQELTFCQVITALHTHTHFNPSNCRQYFCLCQAFPWPKTHARSDTHTGNGPCGSPITWCVMPSFPIFLQKLRKEAAAPLFFLFFSPCLGET